MMRWILFFTLFSRIAFADTECPTITNISDRPYFGYK